MFFMYDQAPVIMNHDANLKLSPITLAQHSIENGRTYTAALLE